MLKQERCFRKQPETFSMIFTQSNFFNSPAMCSRAITFILFPVVVGELFVQFNHILIPVSFGKNTGSRYGGKPSISFNKALMWNFFIRDKTIAIY